jgi:hypothetical protein
MKADGAVVVLDIGKRFGVDDERREVNVRVCAEFLSLEEAKRFERKVREWLGIGE